MRGKDDRSKVFFSNIRLEEDRTLADHPLRAIRQLLDTALVELSRAFAKLMLGMADLRSHQSDCCGC